MKPSSTSPAPTSLFAPLGFPDRLLAPWQSRNAEVVSSAQSVNLQPKPVNLPAQPVNLQPQPVNLQPKPVNPPASRSFGMKLSGRFVSFPGLPANLENALTALKARMPHPEMEDLVLRLCAWRALSTDELASLLQRNRNYITNHLITPLLRSRKLVMTIPDQPNHPEQKYRAAVPPEAKP